MKGKLFVTIFSVIIIGLFFVSCYLMTIVNPPRLPQAESRRYHTENDLYPKESLLPHDNPDYGLEKIPDGVDANEYRKQYMSRVTKYDLEVGKTSYEPGKRVVPPLWPSDNVVEIKVEKQKKKDSNSKDLKISAPVKGHRRSVNDEHQSSNNNTGILLKIVDNSNHKKIEIKLISGGNMRTKTLKKNQTSKPKLTKELQNINNTTDKDYEKLSNKYIEIKGDDIILLNIVDGSDIFLDNSDLSNANDTDDNQDLDMNITDSSYLNKPKYNDTEPVDEGEENVLKKELTRNDMFTLSLQFKNENTSSNSSNSNIQEYNSDYVNSTRKLPENTSLSTETISIIDIV